jgi:hypothetical protein
MTDRYDVQPLDQAAQFADEIRRLWAEIRKLQGAPQVGVSAVSLDANGNPLVVLGTLPDGERGLLINSATHNYELTEMTVDGWSSPHINGDGFDPNALKNIVSGSFVATWGVEFGQALGRGVEVQVPWSTEAGTTGEIMVASNGGAQTVAVAIAANTSGYATVRWLHDLVVGQGPLQLIVYARRTGGAGNVHIACCHAWIQHPDACSSAGTWV